jgi:hypothetical protein
MGQEVARFRKNSQEDVVVSLTEYQGHQLIDVRVFVEADGSEARPTRKGLSLRPELLAPLLEALEKARDVLARRHGR